MVDGVLWGMGEDVIEEEEVIMVNLYVIIFEC